MGESVTLETERNDSRGSWAKVNEVRLGFLWRVFYHRKLTQQTQLLSVESEKFSCKGPKRCRGPRETLLPSALGALLVQWLSISPFFLSVFMDKRRRPRSR